MLKKTITLGFAATMIAGMLFGKDLFSYANTACRTVRTAVKSEIAPEFELERIRHEIDRLMPEISGHLTVVAEQSVDIKDLEGRINEKQTSLKKQKDAILALRDDLSSGKDKFTYRHVSYSRSEVEADLAHRFEAFRSAEDSLKRDQQILAAQQQTLRANQKKLDVMLERKQGLALEVSQLEARLKTIQATEAVNNVEVDDTKLSRVEGMIKEFNRSLDVREALLESEGRLSGRIPVEDRTADEHKDVLSEVDQHFGLSSEASADSGSSI